MTTDIPGPEPIYHSVVEEHGDAAAAARHAAAEVVRRAESALDWSELHASPVRRPVA